MMPRELPAAARQLRFLAFSESPLVSLNHCRPPSLRLLGLPLRRDAAVPHPAGGQPAGGKDAGEASGSGAAEEGCREGSGESFWFPSAEVCKPQRCLCWLLAQHKPHQERGGLLPALGVLPLNHICPLGPTQRVLSAAPLPAKVAHSCSCLPPPQPRQRVGLASLGPSLFVLR